LKTPTNKIILPVAIWGLLQLALLGIGASEFPLWAHHPLPRESLAIQELVCGQTLFIAMLFPILGHSGWAMAVNLALMLPFDELAGLLSNTPQGVITRFVAVAGLWLAGLASWHLWFKDDRVYQTVLVAAVLFTAGGAFIDYCRWESSFAEGQTNPFSPLSILPNICDLAHENGWKSWLEAAVPLVALLAVAVPSTLIKKRLKGLSTSLHPAS
jgi:hypothetical protein